MKFTNTFPSTLYDYILYLYPYKSIQIIHNDDNSNHQENNINVEVCLSKFETIIYDYLMKHINEEECQINSLITHLALHEKIFSEEEWVCKKAELYCEAKNFRDFGDYDSHQVTLAYSLSFEIDDGGNISTFGETALQEHATRQLLIGKEIFGQVISTIHDVFGFYTKVWNTIKGLADKKVYIASVFPVEEVSNLFYSSKKNLLIKLPNERKYSNDLSNIFTTIENKFPDIMEEHQSSSWKFHEKYIDDVFDYNIVAPTKGGISLTKDCQFRCKYCSFNSGECENDTVDFATAKAFIDMLVKNVIKQRLISKVTMPLEILIAGGGEPTYKWNVFVDIVEYIKEISHKHTIPYSLNITTNCCHSPEQTEYIIKNFNQITISFDGLPELQNKNRPLENGQPTFDIVNKTIKKIDESYCNYSILSVVQPEDFSKIKDMALFVFENYPNVYAYTVRPVIIVGRASQNGNYGDFSKEYLSAINKLGEPRKLFSGIFSQGIYETFCGAIYGGHPWLLPNGNIVTCQDAHNDSIEMGKIENGIVSLNKAHDIYATKTFEYMETCKYCIAYYRCRGDCPLKDLTTEMTEYSYWKCNQIKQYWQLVFKKIYPTGSCDGWYLQRQPFIEYSDIVVYELRRN